MKLEIIATENKHSQLGKNTFSRSNAEKQVMFVVDDAGNGRKLGDDPYAVVRNGQWMFPSRLVGWNYRSEPIFVAVHSYLDTKIDNSEAIELASNYLAKIGLFGDVITDPDIIL